MLGTSIMVIVLVALLGSFFGQSTLNQNARNMMASMNDATRVMEEIRRQNTTSLDGSSCKQSNIPSVRPPLVNTTQYENWNDWFDAQQFKSIDMAQADRKANELIVVTCQEVGDQDGDGLANEYCGWSVVGPTIQGQVGRAEWYPWCNVPTDTASSAGSPAPGRIAGSQWGVLTQFDPIRVTVAVGWSQRQPVGNVGGMNSGPEFTFRRKLSGKGTVNPDQLRVGPDADGDGVIDSPAMLTTLVTCR